MRIQMKTTFFIFLILFFVAAGTSGYSQCDPESYTSACIPKLSDGFNFLKSYKVDGQGGNKSKVEYSYVFTKGTQYMLNVCSEGGADGIVVSLYDSRRNKVGTNVHAGQSLGAFVYPCKATGIYYITYTFDSSNSYCGGSALGFKK